jgi:hypothetical protein
MSQKTCTVEEFVVSILLEPETSVTVYTQIIEVNSAETGTELLL